MNKQYIKRLLSGLMVVSLMSVSLVAGTMLQGSKSPIKTLQSVSIGFSKVSAACTSDFVCSGTNDNAQVQAGLDLLPSTGGMVNLLAGNYSFSASVARALNNVTIQGLGSSTYIGYNGSSPIISLGSTSGWVIRDLKLDVGGINFGTATNYKLFNVTIGSTYYSVYPIATTGSNIVIAAHDSSDAQKAAALASGGYVCAGANDDVQIQAAINTLNATGGVLTLCTGSYQIYSPISWTMPNYYAEAIHMEGAQLQSWCSGFVFTINRPATGLGAGLQIYGFNSASGDTHGAGGIELIDTNFVTIYHPSIGNYSDNNAAAIRIKNHDYQCEHNKIYNAVLWGNSIGIAYESDIAVSSYDDNVVDDANINTTSGGYGIKVIQNDGVAGLDRSFFNNVTVHLGGNNSTAFDLGTGSYQQTTFQTPVVEWGAYTGCKIFDGITTHPPTIINPQVVGYPAVYGGNTGTSVLYESTLRTLSGLDRLGELNLLVNGEFATGNPPDSWAYDRATAARETTIVKIPGTYSLKLTATDVFGQAAQYLDSTYQLAQVCGRTLHYGIWVYCPSTNDQPVVIRINYNDGTWHNTDSSSIAADNAWHYVEISMIIPVSGVTTIQQSMIVNNSGAAASHAIAYFNCGRTWVS